MIGRIKDNAGELARQLVRIPTRPIVHSIARPVVPYLSQPYTNVGPFFDEASTPEILWSGFDNEFPVWISCPQFELAEVYVAGFRIRGNYDSKVFETLIEDNPIVIVVPPDTWVNFYALSVNTINVEISLSSGLQLLNNTIINPTFQLQIIGGGP